MRTEKKVIIGYDKGIHTRVAATIVQKTTELEQRFGCRLYMKKADNTLIVPCNSVLTLVGMKLKQDEAVSIFGDGTGSAEAVEALTAFMEGTGAVNEDEVDAIIQENTLTSEKIFEGIHNGLVVMDNSGRVTIFNTAAQTVTGIATNKAIGQLVDDIIPGFGILEILKTGRERLGVKETINGNWVISDKSPVVVDGNIVGAVAVLQDITQVETLSWELNSVKELESKLISILEAVYDGICLIDKNHCITFVNDAFTNIIKRSVLDLSEKSIGILFNGEKIPGDFFDNNSNTVITNADGREFMLDVRPIAVDGAIKGNAIVARELTEITKLAVKVEELSAKNVLLEKELLEREAIGTSFGKIIGKSGVLLEALSVASKASKTDATVLIRGESGTGKELVAKAIHHASNRGNKAFVSMNCAAIPAELLEAELFGYEKGAFTGALRMKPGKFELADGGTIFLDEIGDMERAMQAKLLRVLQEQEVERIGSLGPKKINVRVIAATNAPLEKLMENGSFRKDLYYRLNVISVILPPLRQRKGDIPLLAEAFIDKICMRYHLSEKHMTKPALACLEHYNFPGNVRELENIIERGITLSASKRLDISDLPTYVRVCGENIPGDTSKKKENGEKIPTYAEMERTLIARALETFKTFRKAGEALGLDHKTVSAKAKKYGL